MRRGAPFFACVLLLVGCGREAEPQTRLPAAAHAEGAAEHAEAAPEQAAPEEAAPQTFGAAIDEELPMTALADIVADPERFRDQVVRTEGEVARVCQQAGCWMELRDEDGPGVRVPMAGHAFFLPRDSAGRHAQMMGRVTIRELSPDVRAHLESEGAVATSSSLSIHATGVAMN